jgi:ATP:ADP antiporter, AAA family
MLDARRRAVARQRQPREALEEVPIPSRLATTLARRLGLEPDEQRTLFLMGLLVATLLCAYTLAKVVRDALFLANFGALALPYAYVGVALASVAYVAFEGRLQRRYTRLDLTRFNQLVAIAIGLMAAIAYPMARTATTALFYLWTGSQAMLLIPHFWVLALDVWDSHRARRLFPLLSGCGLIGGLAGGGIAGWLTPFVKRVGLIWIVAALLILAHVLTRALARHRARRPGTLEFANNLSRWGIIRRSGYLRLLASALALAVIVGTLIDFQFKLFIQRAYPDPHQLTQFLGRFQVALNAVALLLQFGAAGWLLHRFGLATASILQPISIVSLGAWVATTGGWIAVVVLRWVQGVVQQTLGKSTTEIYYMAVRPPERRRIKPAIDTLVERWSDAVVGVLLISLLGAVGVPLNALIGVTIGIAVIWLFLLFLLNRQYGRSFQRALSQRWIEDEVDTEALNNPAVVRALMQALRSDDEKRIVVALRLAGNVRGRGIERMVRQSLAHPSHAVRAAAIGAMEALQLRDPRGRITRFLEDEHEDVSTEAVRYCMTMSQDPAAFVRGLLEREDPAMWRRVVDALFERPHVAPGAISLEWVDARIATQGTEDLILAARALGATPGSTARARLHVLLDDPDIDVKRAALLSAARRPSALLVDPILPLLFVPELATEARAALAACGDAAVLPLARILVEDAPSARAQALAARTLAEIGSPRAIDALMVLVRSPDLSLRLLGLRSVSAIHVLSGKPVLTRALVHKLFLREIRGFRSWIEPALELEGSGDPEIRLLAESYREFAEAALERAMRALACWYDVKPLSGAFERLKTSEFESAAPALEYLVHILPRQVFKPVGEIFESKLIRERGRTELTRERLIQWIQLAWQSGDAWLRACAVRASRLILETEPRWFIGGRPSPIVEAELAARFQEEEPVGGRRVVSC